MSIDKHSLRSDAVRAGGGKWHYVRSSLHSKAYITDEKGSTVINCTLGDVPANCAGFIESANPATVIALLDELDKWQQESSTWQSVAEKQLSIATEMEAKLQAAEKRIAVLGRYLKCAHAFIENTEAFGHEAASGILKCGDSEWNVDASKESLAAAGITVKGE